LLPLSWISDSKVFAIANVELLFWSILSAFFKNAKSSIVFVLFFGFIETIRSYCYFSYKWSISIPSSSSLNILFFLFIACLSGFKNSNPVKYYWIS
jgi:hypothetical protein